MPGRGTQISSPDNTNPPFGGSCLSMWISSKPIAFSTSFGAVAMSAPAGVHCHCWAKLGFTCETSGESQSHLNNQPAKQQPALEWEYSDMLKHKVVLGSSWEMSLPIVVLVKNR